MLSSPKTGNVASRAAEQQSSRMSTDLSKRKQDHLALCATDAVAFRGQGTLFDCVKLVHNALPELSLDEVDTRVVILGKTLKAPLFIAAMTGGTDEALTVNRTLASIAEARGYGFGLGSQRAMHRSSAAAYTYDVRKVAPHALVLGNIGIVQAREMSTEEVRALCDASAVDAVCIHMNPAMEVIQPGGDRDFRGGIETLQRLVRELGKPIVAKETGCGISRALGQRLRTAGIEHVDVSGAGGTSWVGVETLRADSDMTRSVGELLWDWGVPTAASVGSVAPLGFDTVIATGGIKTGLDVAKSLVLGANAAGIARPVLMALREGGVEGATAFLEGLELALRAIMLLTGSRTIGDLRQAPKMVVGELETWLKEMV